MKKLSDLDLGIEEDRVLKGKSIRIDDLLNNEIEIHFIKVQPSKKQIGQDCLHIQIRFENEWRVLFTGAKYLMNKLQKVPESIFPIKATITREGRAYFIN